MFEAIIIILCVIALLTSLFTLFAVWRLYKYIRYVIEDKQDELEDKSNNVIQTLKIIVQEGLVKSNGRIKKPYMTKTETY